MADQSTPRWFRARTPAALGAALRHVRRSRGLTQTELGDRIGASRPTVSRMDRGSETVSLGTVLDVVAECGFELIVVPRGSMLKVEFPEDQ
ncbi:helix-turn-helix transcriptional regulator [Cellulomonas sp. APG4]|uniref:helix-turn-helix domain-containing protein n=1 Tax=Cellulomonas sp. APG4 TaxID=1538656 RepID=UPI00137B69BF|nr:helix-turn-helix transcriptional regulator [Cellulomonas sp. APG4]NCT91964.1 helix-turn-helix transcriptional regulator [Cellulomonas sp. APG4]